MELMRLLFAGESKQNGEAARMCGKFYWFNYDDPGRLGVLQGSSPCHEQLLPGRLNQKAGINRRTANLQWLRTGVGNPSAV